ncbi:S8 family serine peptidase [Thermopolyspora sp. NPDC052614]|uniref:S8 family peptidase n=1 Tax=Thermopolyspora sp. NPDC052614 TaxID=3155682 RepID=UPI0034156406
MTEGKLSDGFRRHVARAGEDEVITALVRTTPLEPGRETLRRLRAMTEGERLATARAELLCLVTERYGHGEAFRKNLRDELRERQARVLAAAPEAYGLWLADAVAVSGTPAELADLARHEDVLRVEANPVFRIPEFAQTPIEHAPGPVDGSAWGVAGVGAPEAWGGFGRGDGVLVGHLDTGVDDTHPALAGKVAAFQEFDALGAQVVSTPHDSDAHGTHTAGTIAGRTARGVNIGVAPGTRLASALVLPGGSGTFAQIVAGMQWAVDEGAHVLGLSVAAPGYHPIWNLPVLNAVLGGVAVVAAIGTGGQGDSAGPGNDPLAIGVGATDPGGLAAAFSGGGLLSPAWFGHRIRYGKPDLSAPGARIVSAVPGGGLAAVTGTSPAAAHTVGAVALLQSGMPALKGDPFATRAILLGTARRCGEAGKDQRFGFGRLDAYAAARQAAAFR